MPHTRAPRPRPFPLQQLGPARSDGSQEKAFRSLENKRIEVIVVNATSPQLDGDGDAEAAAANLKRFRSTEPLKTMLKSAPWSAGKRNRRPTRSAFSDAVITQDSGDERLVEFWERGSKPGSAENRDIAAAFAQITAASRAAGVVTTDDAHSLRLWALAGLLHAATTAVNRSLSFRGGDSNGVFGLVVQRLFDARFDWLKLRKPVEDARSAGRDDHMAAFKDARRRTLAAVYELATVLFDASYLALMHVDVVVAPSSTNGSVNWSAERDGAWLTDGLHARTVNAFFDSVWPGLATVSTANRRTRQAKPTIVKSEEVVKRRAAEYMAAFGDSSTLAGLTEALHRQAEPVSLVDRLLRIIDAAALSVFVAMQLRPASEGDVSASSEETAVLRAVQLYESSFSFDTEEADASIDSAATESDAENLASLADMEELDQVVDQDDTAEAASIDFMAAAEPRYAPSASERAAARRHAAAARHLFSNVNKDIMTRGRAALASAEATTGTFRSVTGAVETNLLSHMVASCLISALLQFVIAPAGVWYPTGFTLVASRHFRVASLETTAALLTEQCTLDLQPGAAAYHEDYARFRRWAAARGLEGTSVPESAGAPGFYPLAAVREYVRVQRARGAAGGPDGEPSFACAFLAVNADADLPNLAAAAPAFFSGLLPETVFRTGFVAADPTLAGHLDEAPAGGDDGQEADVAPYRDNRTTQGPLSIFRASAFAREATLLHRLARERSSREGARRRGWALRTPAMDFSEHTMFVNGLLDDLYARYLRSIAGRYLSDASDRAAASSGLAPVYAELRAALPFDLEEAADAASEGLVAALTGPFSSPLYLGGRGEAYVVRALQNAEAPPSPSLFFGGPLPVSPAEAAASPLASPIASVVEGCASPDTELGTVSAFFPDSPVSPLAGIPAVTVPGTAPDSPALVVDLPSAGQAEAEEDLEISSIPTITNAAAVRVRRERKRRGRSTAVFSENIRRLDPGGGSLSVETGVSTATFCGVPLLFQSTAESFTRPRRASPDGNFTPAARRSYNLDDLEASEFHIPPGTPVRSRILRENSLGTPFASPAESRLVALNKPREDDESETASENNARLANTYARTATIFDGASFVGRLASPADRFTRSVDDAWLDEERNRFRARRMIGGGAQTHVLRSPFWAEHDASTAAADAITQLFAREEKKRSKGRRLSAPAIQRITDAPFGSPAFTASTPASSAESEAPEWLRTPAAITPIRRATPATGSGTRLRALLGDLSPFAELGTPASRGSPYAASGPGSGSTADLLALEEVAVPDGRGSRLFAGPIAAATRDAQLCAAPIPNPRVETSTDKLVEASNAVFACSTSAAMEANAKFILDHLAEKHGPSVRAAVTVGARDSPEKARAAELTRFAAEAWNVRASIIAKPGTAAPLYGDVLRANADLLSEASTRWERMGARQEVLADASDASVADFMATMSPGELDVFMLSPSSLDLERAADIVVSDSNDVNAAEAGASADTESFGVLPGDAPSSDEEGEDDFLASGSPVARIAGRAPADARRKRAERAARSRAALDYLRRTNDDTFSESPADIAGRAPADARRRRAERAARSRAALEYLKNTDTFSDRHLAIMFLTNCGVLPPASEAASDLGGARCAQMARFFQDRILSFSDSEPEDAEPGDAASPARSRYLARFSAQGRELTPSDIFPEAEVSFASSALADSLALAGLNLGRSGAAARRRRRWNVSPVFGRGAGGFPSVPATPAARRAADASARTSVVAPLTEPVMKAFGLADSDHRRSRTISLSPLETRQAPRWAALRVPLDRLPPIVAAILSPEDAAKTVAAGAVAEAAVRQTGVRFARSSLEADLGVTRESQPVRRLVLPLESVSGLSGSDSSGIFALDEQTKTLRRLSDVGELVAAERSPDVQVLTRTLDGNSDLEVEIDGRFVPLQVVGVDLSARTLGSLRAAASSPASSPEGGTFAVFDPLTKELRRLSIETERARMQRLARPALGSPVFLDERGDLLSPPAGVYTDAAGFADEEPADRSSVSALSENSSMFALSPLTPLASAGQAVVSTAASTAVLSRIDIATSAWPEGGFSAERAAAARNLARMKQADDASKQRYRKEPRRSSIERAQYAGQPLTPLAFPERASLASSLTAAAATPAADTAFPGLSSAVWADTLAPLLLAAGDGPGDGPGVASQAAAKTELVLRFSVPSPVARSIGVISLVGASQATADSIMRAGAVFYRAGREHRFFRADAAYFQGLASSVRAAAAYARSGVARSDARDASALYALNLASAIASRLVMAGSGLEAVAFEARSVFSRRDDAYYPREAPDTEAVLTRRRHDDSSVPLMRPFCYFPFTRSSAPLAQPSAEVLVLPYDVYAPLLAAVAVLAANEFRFSATSRLTVTIRENKDVATYLGMM